MARINFCVVRQAEQALDDVGAQLLVAAAREVGAPDATTEKCVAGEDPTLYLCIETDTAHGVTRCANDFESALPYFDDFAVLQVNIRQVAIAHERHSKHHSLLPRAEKVALHVGMRRHLDAVTLFDGSVAHDMINMAVCVDDH